MSKYVDANRASWDERVADHLVAYQAEAFADDPAGDTVDEDFQLIARHLPAGSVDGLDMVHLQCHIGLDTISWARRGASVTGTDFSEEAIHAAQRLAKRAGVDAAFVHCVNEDAPFVLGREFDIVFTSVGAIVWLERLDTWAEAIHELLKPGGLFYIRDGHPLMSALADDRDDDLLVVDKPYFGHGRRLRFDDGLTYASDTVLENAVTYEWPHSLSEIITALLNAGLRIEAFGEHTTMPWNALPALTRGDHGYHLADRPERTPLMFSIAARRPLN